MSVSGRSPASTKDILDSFYISSLVYSTGVNYVQQTCSLNRSRSESPCILAAGGQRIFNL